MIRHSVANIDKPVSELVLGTDDFVLESQDFHHEMMDTWLLYGGNAIDTGRCYGPTENGFESERVIGNWLEKQDKRNEVVIITKGCHPTVPGISTARMTPEDIASDIRESRSALQLDCIDIFLFHRDDPGVPVGPIMEWINHHIDAGHIATIGASNWSASRVEQANAYADSHHLHGFSMLSNYVGLGVQGNPMWPGCRSVNESDRLWLQQTCIPNLAWSSQSRGFFSGKYHPADTSNKDMVGTYYNDENWARLDRATKLAGKHKCSPTQIACSYTLSQDFNSMGVIGPANQDELLMSIEATTHRLSQSEISWLETGHGTMP